MMPSSAEAVADARAHLADGVEPYRSDEGNLRLRGPLLKRGPLRRLMARIFRLAVRVEVELDDAGSFVVERLDGRRLGEIAEDLAAHLKLRRREAEGALVAFLQLLLRRKLVRIELPGSGAR